MAHATLITACPPRVLLHSFLWPSDVEGVVRVSFEVSPQGYADAFRVVRSSGREVLDREAHSVVHLAEPLPYIDGPLEVDITFIR